MNLKTCAISFGIVLLVCVPIILMIIINSFDLSEIHIGKITVPRLESNRYETLTILSSKNVVKALLENFRKSAKMLLIQSDGFNANALVRIWDYICFFFTNNDNRNDKKS